MVVLRIWHYKLLEVLPDLQFKGQLRELVVIMRDWRDKGKTNHILINAVTEYPKSHLSTYFNNSNIYPEKEYNRRYEELIKFLSYFKKDYGYDVKVIKTDYDNDKYNLDLEPYKDEKEWLYMYMYG